MPLHWFMAVGQLATTFLFSQRSLDKYAAIDLQYHCEDEINFIIIVINKIKVTTAKIKNIHKIRAEMKDEHNKINRHLSRLIANLPLKRLTNDCDTRKVLLRKVEAELIFFATGAKSMQHFM